MDIYINPCGHTSRWTRTLPGHSTVSGRPSRTPVVAHSAARTPSFCTGSNKQRVMHELPRLPDLQRALGSVTVAAGSRLRLCCLLVVHYRCRTDNGARSTYRTQNRTGHPGYPAVQLRLTCDQIRSGSESSHEKWKQLGTMSTFAIIGKQTALDFRYILCIVAHTISKS